MDIDVLINEIKPSEASIDLCLRGDLLSEFDTLGRQMAEFDDWKADSLSAVDPRTPIRARLAELRELMKASTRTFVFRSLGEQGYSDLLAKHPSPKNDKGEEEYAFNPRTFPVALVAACAIEPSMSLKQAEQLFDRLNLDQRNVVFDGAMRANMRSVDVPFFAAGSEPAASTELS